MMRKDSFLYYILFREKATGRCEGAKSKVVKLRGAKQNQARKERSEAAIKRRRRGAVRS